MYCKEPIISIPTDNPFQNDLFGLSEFAVMLSNLSEHLSEQGAVIGINADWGVGKTTFLKMWEQSLKNQGFTTLFFNAWKSDFHEDPLIALMGEFKKKFQKSSNIDSFISSGAKLVSRYGFSALKGILRNKLGVDIDEVVDDAADMVSQAINEYQDREDTLEDFKKELAELVADPQNEKSVVVIIDELDRCNPHFAVRLLERIKHLFEVPNIIFVLGLNINQLQYAVQGFYGSTNIDGREYLRRFIDLEISLPKPNTESFAKHLFKELGFIEMFQAHNNAGWVENRDKEGTLFIDAFVDMLTAYKLNLRLIIRIFTFMRLALAGAPKNERIDADLFCFLCFLKFILPEVYTKIENQNYSLQQLLDEIERVFPSTVLRQTSRFGTQRRMAWLTAKLIVFYNSIGINSQHVDENFKGTPVQNKAYYSYPLTPQIISSDTLNEALSYYEQRDRFGYENGLRPIFQTINLARNIRLQ